ncbi:MAG TPA: sulfurtransferase-like selenium metabolism protein YedF [bacterium]|nr:sulfurtransferase-like selenium metabolism protein YedF [bacterium]
MNESSKMIDARGQACPGPVILLKKALEAGEKGLIDILVDNEAARENVTRFASKKGCAIIASTGAVPDIRVTVSPSSASGAKPMEAGPSETTVPAKAPASRADERPLVVLIESDRMGIGNDELGALLIRGFLYALTERDEQPDAIILMNHGVLLAVEGSDSLENLRRLVDLGVELLACGTCLEFLGVKNKLAVGRVSNMYEIADRLSSARVLSV